MDLTKATTHVGLCAGYGGIELGLKRVIPNLRTVALCEIEAFAIANLVAKMEAGLMDPAPIWPDLKTFPWESFRDRVGLLTGGYPCQPFSKAGKRLGTEDPRHLWPFIADGIRAMRPTACFFENVEGHISLGLRAVLSELESIGYRCAWGIFSAAEVGAPHQRKRVFILAHSGSQRRQQNAGSSFGNESANGGAGRDTQQPYGNNVAKCNGEVSLWPSRPSQPQHSWEPPRVVGDADSVNRRPSSVGRVNDAEAGPAGEAMANAELHGHSASEITGGSGSEQGEGRAQQFERVGASRRDISDATSRAARAVGDAKVGQGYRRESGDMGLEASQGGCSNDAVDVTGQAVENTIRSVETRREPIGGEEGGWRSHHQLGGSVAHAGETQPSLGGDPDGDSSRLDYAKLCVSGDNRTDELRLCGNGVVPATAELAFRTLLAELSALPNQTKDN